MSKFRFGPQIDGLVSVGGPAPPGGPSGKSDVQIIYRGKRGLGLFDFEVPAYDLTKFNQLLKIHAVFIPDGHAVPASADVAMGPDYPIRSSLDVSTVGNAPGATTAPPAPPAPVVLGLPPTLPVAGPAGVVASPPPPSVPTSVIVTVDATATPQGNYVGLAILEDAT